MEAVYITVAHEATAEFEEKRSLFLGHAIPAKTEEEAMAFIKRKQSEYRDATHNVWAYYMKNGVLARYSDDGEPTGTAGLPALEAIRKSGVNDVCVVITRYFGGVLLGAGGLVRAYSKSAAMAIEAAEPVTYENYSELRITCSYADYQKIAIELSKFKAKTDSADFSDKVLLCAAVPEPGTAELVARIAEMTAGRALSELTGTRFDK